MVKYFFFKFKKKKNNILKQKFKKEIKNTEKEKYYKKLIKDKKSNENIIKLKNELQQNNNYK